MFSISRTLTVTACLAITCGLTARPASADCGAFGDVYLGSICQAGFNFCPRGYADTSGQILPIDQNQALFALLGTIYGGDGRTTFALPDLRGRKMVHVGQGAGLSNIVEGQRAGSETVTLSNATMPVHNHGATTTTPTMTLRGINSTAGNNSSPAGDVLAATRDRGRPPYPYSTAVADVDMGASAIDVTAATTVQNTGASQAFNIRDPMLGIRHCIAVNGLFPPRN